MDKDQTAFIKHCKQVLPDYDYLIQKAKDAANLAGDNCEIEYQRANVRRRAGNLVLLAALKEIGAEQWRPDKNGNKPKPNYSAKVQNIKPVNIGHSSQKELPAHLNGKILRDAGLTT